MRRRIPVLLGVGLLLGGCTATSAPGSPEEEVVSPTATQEDAPAEDAAELTLGEWAPADCPVGQPCDVEFRITDILVAENCEFGLKPDAEPLAEDTWLITVYTEARAELTSDGKPHVFSSPKVIDSQGEVQEASYEQPCSDNPANAEFGYLLTGLDENSEARFADNLAVPAGSAALLFEGYRITLPGAGESSGAPAPTAPVVTDTDGGPVVTGTDGGAAAPAVMGACDPDGTAMFSDGVRRPVTACAGQGEAGRGGAADPESSYRCADTGAQVSDPAECVTPTTPQPKPAPTSPGTTTTTIPPATRTVHPDPGGFANDYERELWTACANKEVTDRLVCSTMYELYGRP